MKVAIIERHRFGGTCVNTGCTPTKTLVASAYAAHMARRGADYGFSIGGDVTVDMKRVKARKDDVAGRSTRGVERSLKKLENCRVYEGHARFVSPREVQVGTEILSSDRIFINVGGRAAVPAIPGLDQVGYLTNSTMMEVDFLPRHLLVLGGSYIGLEFGQMYCRFGSEVTIVEIGPRLIPREDEDVSEAVAGFLVREGINIRLSATCLSVAKARDDIVMRLDCGEGAPEIGGSHLLIATGRRPNTDDLGLERAGVKRDSRGFIEVDDELRTNIPGIWALGDCNGRGAFTHTSWNDFEIVAGNLLDGDHRRVSDRIPAYALFTDPPLGRAGMTEAEVRESGRRALIAKIAMEDVSRAFEKGDRGLHEDPGRRRHEGDPGRLVPGHERRRGDPLRAGRHVRPGALHGAAARDAHPSDRLGVHSDDAGRPRAAPGAGVPKARGRIGVRNASAPAGTIASSSAALAARAGPAGLRRCRRGTDRRDRPRSIRKRRDLVGTLVRADVALQLRRALDRDCRLTEPLVLHRLAQERSDRGRMLAPADRHQIHLAPELRLRQWDACDARWPPASSVNTIFRAPCQQAGAPKARGAPVDGPRSSLLHLLA
jgi:pyruvate/2-oxoglutarate dehydrogenase complex dihydrolipoamide dehydrogenase (E3) component